MNTWVPAEVTPYGVGIYSTDPEINKCVKEGYVFFQPIKGSCRGIQESTVTKITWKAYAQKLLEHYTESDPRHIILALNGIVKRNIHSIDSFYQEQLYVIVQGLNEEYLFDFSKFLETN